MNITDDIMLKLTAEMPMKQIDINGQPYLQRYYAGTTGDGHDIWLHRFLSCDGERHLHSHPFEARSIILAGGYTEEHGNEHSEGVSICEPSFDITLDWLLAILSHPESLHARFMRPGRVITVFDWHRIASVKPDTWTMFVVAPRRLPMWFFRSDDGDLEPVVASPRDWWQAYGHRPA